MPSVTELRTREAESRPQACVLRTPILTGSGITDKVRVRVQKPRADLHPRGRTDYLGEGIHTAPSLKEQLDTVGVDTFSGHVQGSQTFLQHTRRM